MNIDSGSCLEMIDNDLIGYFLYRDNDANDTFILPVDLTKTESDVQEQEEINTENFNQAFIKYECDIIDCKPEPEENNEDDEERAVIEKSLDLRSVENSTEMKQRKEKLFRCKVCKYVVSGVLGIKTHININHTKELTLVSKQAGSTSNSSACDSKKPFNCKFCGYGSKQPKDLEEHICTLHGFETSYECYYKNCSHKTTMLSFFLDHLKYGHSKKAVHSCQMCEFKSTRKVELKTHVDTVHTDKDLFKCGFCSFLAVKSVSVRQHIHKKHKNEKLFACKSCSFTSLRFDELQEHVYTSHPKKNIYKCPGCNYTSSRMYEIRLHTRRRHPDIVN